MKRDEAERWLGARWTDMAERWPVGAAKIGRKRYMAVNLRGVMRLPSCADLTPEERRDRLRRCC